MKYPSCGLENPPSALRCDCGDSLQKGQIEGRQPSFHGSAGTLFRIWIVNLLTLGSHYFGGKVKIHRYAYSQTEFEGDRFAYHGTGKELLIGFLKASPFIVFIVFCPALVQLFWTFSAAELVAGFCMVVAIALLLPIATVGASRYRLSRTSWRGIRFSFRVHTKDFLRLYFKGCLWLILTFGLYRAYF